MSLNNDLIKEHFQKNDTVSTYDATIGNVTRILANDILSRYLESDSLEGKVVLDNACGTGVVTKELISRTDDIVIEAADLSEPMVNYLRSSITNDQGMKVTTKVMDAQV
jgi:ubiquinone/menaquinone biosynthesis C-methylase UbiE